MPRTCPMCGENVFPDSATCEYCGEPLSGGIGEWYSQGLWRDGNTLVMEKNAQLPDRCVKTNVPAERRLKRRLYWHHPALYILIVACGLIPYVIIALIVRQQATIHIALSDEWFGKRLRATLFGWLAVVLGVVLLVVGIGSLDKVKAGPGPNAGPFIILGAILLGLLGAIFGLVGSRMVYPKKITKTHVWLNGVCREFLGPLPEWRGGA